MWVSDTISISAARQVLARVHRLEQPLPGDGLEAAMSVFNRHQCIQSDPIEVAGRNADLTLFTRACNYRPEHLPILLYKKKRLFEYFCKMHSIMPIELYPIFRHKMNAYSKHKRIVSFFRKYRKQTRHVLNELENGPLSSRNFKGMGNMKTGWGHNANLSNIILSRLWMTGKVAISHRDGVTKYYTLTERAIPEKILRAEPPKRTEDLLEIAKVIVKASRLVTASGSPEQWYQVGGTKRVREILDQLKRKGDLVSLRLEGTEEKFYIPSEDTQEWNKTHQVKGDYVRFIAPLDPMIWSRRVFRQIYGREYGWEVYKKERDRRYCYYCLPIIYSSDYVGLMEPFFRKTDRTLEIRNLHILNRSIVRNKFLKALSREMNRFCSYLGAQSVEVMRGPDWVTRSISTTP